MGEVIKLNFKKSTDKSGYLMDGSKIDGIYQGNLAACVDRSRREAVCHIGNCGGEEMYMHNPVELSIKELNEFCIMWLLIFDPDVIKVDKDSNTGD